MSTGIAWTDATWNPLRARPFVVAAGKEDGWHCEHVSEGCRNCYAETQNVTQRWDRGTGLAYTRPNREKVEVYLDEKTLTQPLRWRKPRKVFVCFMTDLFGEWVTDEMLDRVFAVMALTPHITYQVLTKRPERMRAYLTWTHESGSDRAEAVGYAVMSLIDDMGVRGGGVATSLINGGPCSRMRAAGVEGASWPLPNVWMGTSVEDQPAADRRIAELLATPAVVRFLSCEPLLGPVAFACIPSDHAGAEFISALHGYYWNNGSVPEQVAPSGRIDWVIVGGESGPKARPCDLAWIRSIVAQCKAAGVACFVKQLGARPWLDSVHLTASGAVLGWPQAKVREYYGRRIEVRLRHSHGGTPDEWPEDLRVREFPGGDR